MTDETISLGRFNKRGDNRILCWLFAVALLAVGIPMQGAAFLPNTWPCGIVPYQFGSTMALASERQKIFSQAVKIWENAASVHFVQRTTEANFVQITNDILPPPESAHANVGMTGGEQDLTANFDDSSTANLFVIVHELGHVLGLIHEHQRSDVLSYLHVSPLLLLQPDFVPKAAATIAYSPPTYDFESVMQYTANILYQRFGINDFVPLPAFSVFASSMGQRTHLSALDIRGMINRYGSVGLNNCAIVITPANSIVYVNDIQSFSAQLTDESGSTASLNDFQWFAIDSSVATIECPGCKSSPADIGGVRAGTTIIKAYEANLQAEGYANITVIDPPPPPPGNSGCWTWVSALHGGLGGYVWTCTGPPPPGGGTPPGQCWRWDPTVSPHGAWLYFRCGGGCVTRSGTPSTLSFADCHPTGTGVTSVTSGDPNDKAGAQGIGIQRYIAGTTPLRYGVFFGNEPTASGAAQTVTVTDSLSASVDDLTTFSFGPIAFGDRIVTPPPGTNYSTTVDLRPETNLIVGVNANFSPETGLVTWKFASLDPSTHTPTTDPSAGFLPPGGNGSVFFTIMPKQKLSTGSTVHNQATVVFDRNAPISTPTWLNTLDFTPPASKLLPLPATETASSFAAHWQGSDAGSGIATYTVYVSADGGPFTPWLTNTTSTTDTYTGAAGHSYGFYSIATDLVGNVESAKTTAETTTTVQDLPSCATDLSSQITVVRGGFRYNRAAQSFVQTVTVKNNGTPVSGAALVLDSLSPTATLNGSIGKTQCAAPLGSPWVSVPGTLATGQSISLTLTFSDPTQAAIQYSTRVLAGNGQQ